MSGDAKAEACAFFAKVFHGSHHHGKFRQGLGHYQVSCHVGEAGAATYNNDVLTRFVLLCHQECWRGAVRNGGPGALVFMITKRARIEDRPNEEMSAVHPTLQQAVECLAEGGHWGTYWRARKEAPAPTVVEIANPEAWAKTWDEVLP